MQVDILDFNMANNTISNRDSGELTLVISSIKTRVGHCSFSQKVPFSPIFNNYIQGK